MRAKLNIVLVRLHGGLWPHSGKHWPSRSFCSTQGLIKTTVATWKTFRVKSALVLDKMSDDGEAYVPPAWGFFAAELFLAVSQCVHLVSLLRCI